MQGKQYAGLPSAVAVDGMAIGAELKRAQVTLYPLLRLPSSLEDVDGFL
jgi:hypothetical protein